MNDAELILVAGSLLAAGIGASLLAARLRLPGLVLFLALGMAIGSDGVGWIEFNDYELARTIGVIALALILFEGGLTSGYLEIRPVLRPALSLAGLGTIVTAVVTGLAASWLLGFSLLEGLLLGSILAATDGAAIFALLRGSTLRRRLARTLGGGVRVQRSRGHPAGARVHRLDPAFRLRDRRHGLAVRARARHRPGRGGGGGGWRRLGLPPPEPGDPRPLPGGLDRHRWASPTAARRSSTAPASWPSTWRGWRSAAPRSPPSARSPPSTRASPGSPRSPSSSPSGCSSSRVSSGPCSSTEP